MALDPRRFMNLHLGTDAYKRTHRLVKPETAPRPPRPETVSVEIVDGDFKDAEEIARLTVAAWHQAYRGVMPDQVLKHVTPRYFEQRWGDLLLKRQPMAFTLIAIDEEGAIVGALRAGPADGQTPPMPWEIYTLNVMPRFQRLGVGGQLLDEAQWRLAEMGADECFLWVLKANQKARYFFKQLGGRIIGQGDERMGPATLPKIAYGWPDLLATLDLDPDEAEAIRDARAEVSLSPVERTRRPSPTVPPILDMPSVLERTPPQGGRKGTGLRVESGDATTPIARPLARTEPQPDALGLPNAQPNGPLTAGQALAMKPNRPTRDRPLTEQEEADRALGPADLLRDIMDETV